MMRYFDLGLDENIGCSKDENVFKRDSPKVVFKFDPDEISSTQVREAGKKINKNRCISMLFLLLNNIDKALKLCTEVVCHFTIFF